MLLASANQSRCIDDKEDPMTTLSFDWQQGAPALLLQAQQQGELAKLIMGGTHYVESWLIEHRILPALLQHPVNTLRFSLKGADKDRQAVTLVPLPDGSAFACATSGIWSALDPAQALHEVQHIGFRFAPGSRWQQDFEAALYRPDHTAVAVAPDEVAKLWEKVTGTRPHGFSEGTMDQLQALGLGVMDKVFSSQGHLGL